MEKPLTEISIPELIMVSNTELEKMNYRPGSIKLYKYVWRRFAEYAIKKDMNTFSEQLGADFLKDIYGWPSSEKNSKYMVHAARSIRVLGDIKSHGLILRSKRIVWRDWEDSYSDILNQFKSYVAGSLSEKSINRIETVLAKFFAYLFANGVNDSRFISIEHIDGFVSTLSGYAKKTLAVKMYSLRTFLKFLYDEKILEHDLRKYVPTITHVNRRNVPATWSKDETQRILDAIDRANPCGMRDYAILMTISRLGLRQSDIIGLKFEHIDWAKSQISIIQNKTKKLISLPLPEDAGHAIIDYLKNGRPPSDETYIFVKHIAPFEKMHTVYMLLDKYLRLAQIERKPGQPKGSHTLRHSLAGRMLEKRIPIETISSVLGHTSVDSTLDYLPIDMTSLIECVIDPEGVLIHG